MDGDDVGTSDTQRLATAVMARAKAIRFPDGTLKYDLTPGRRTGGRKRLAEDSGMESGQLTRFLAGERMPDVRKLAALARCIGTTLDVLLLETDNHPTETAPQAAQESVGSRPLTPDAKAVAWQVGTAETREMYESLRKKPKLVADDDSEGRAEAQG